MKQRLTDEQLQAKIIEALDSDNDWRNYDEIAVSLRSTGFSFNEKRFRDVYRNVLASRVPALEVVEENVRLAKLSQRERDANRIRNKAFREHARIDNALSASARRIQEILLSRRPFPAPRLAKKQVANGEEKKAIVQLSDLHLNELVSTQVNTYDFSVAARRLKEYARKARFYLAAQGVKSVVVANTGDVLNSDRRLDEYLSQATNRMNAAMLAVHLISCFLSDLSQDFAITYLQVSGNESRVKDEPGNTDVVLSDNYDILIYNILKLAFANGGVQFQDGDISERVVRMFDRNVLITHGEQISQSGAIADVQKIKGKYAQYGVVVDFVVFGHVHCAHVHDHFARGASLVGANAYTDRGLQLTTRASQNIHIFSASGGHDSIVVDLQDVPEEGYPINSELAAYNAKSEKKLHQQTVIHEIVV